MTDRHEPGNARDRSGSHPLTLDHRGISVVAAALCLLACSAPPRRLPVSPINHPWPQGRHVDTIETAGIDVDVVWVRSRHVEGMHSAMAAEGVLRRIGVELISRQRVFAAQELKLFRRHDQMQDTFLCTDRAVALGGP